MTDQSDGVYRVEFSEPFEADMDTVYLRLSRLSPHSASQWQAGIIDACLSLDQFPRRCPVASDSEDFQQEVRQLNYRHRSKVYLLLFTIKAVQVATVAYAHSHNDYLPPMQSAAAALAALRPLLGHAAEYRARNPATETPFTPNAALSSRKMGAVSHGGKAILFYDADPSTGWRESYYVTIKGIVGHVPVGNLPRLLTASRQE